VIGTPTKGSGDLLCELFGQIADPHETLPTRSQIIATSPCQMFVEGGGKRRGSEQRNAGDKENKNRNTVRTCSARSPGLISSTEFLKRLSVSIRTLRNIKLRRAVVTQLGGRSVSPSSGPNMHKKYTFFT
jgi:hypothetical protein